MVETYRYLDAKRSFTEQELLTQAEQESDLLLQHILKHFATRIAYACERLKLVIDQLDELFVGTLDSFSQNYYVSLLLRVAKLNALKSPMMLKPIVDN